MTFGRRLYVINIDKIQYCKNVNKAELRCILTDNSVVSLDLWVILAPESLQILGNLDNAFSLVLVRVKILIILIMALTMIRL
jgi:hypothetical protein